MRSDLKTLYIRLVSEQDHERMRVAAAREDVSLAEWCRRILVAAAKPGKASK